MTDDPFAPPASELDDAPVEVLDVGECLRVAWSCTWATFPLWVGVMLVHSILVAVATLLCVVPVFFVGPALHWGSTRFLLNVLDGKERFEDLFEGFQDVGRCFPPMFAVVTLQLLLWLPGELPSLIGEFSESVPMSLVGIPVSTVWTTFVVSRVLLAPFLVVERGMGGLDAIRASWRITSEHLGPTFLLGFLTALFPMLGIFLLCIGVFPATMIVYLMWAIAHRQLLGTPDGEPAPPG